MFKSWGRLAALTAILCLPVVGAVPPVAAVPGDGAPVTAPTVPLPELGAVGPLEFYGDTGSATLTFPVPPGLTPVTLNATFDMPVFVRSAVITVTQDRRTLAQIELPLIASGPIEIPLAGVEVQDNAATVTIHSYLLPVDGYCLDPSNPLRLVDGSVTYSGTESVPTAVADFLPPVLRTLTIAVPREPTLAESDAAVRVATAVTAHYGAQNIRVAVTALDGDETMPAEASAPLERQIVVREGPDAGLSLRGGPGVGVLTISGPAAELGNQTRLLASDVMRLAVSSGAVVGPLRSAPQLPGDTVTLRELGEPGATAVALAPQVTIGLDQTRLGRSARGFRVHLVGSYTPVPENIGALLVARAGGETFDRWEAAPDGRIDRWVEVPDRLLRRYTGVDVAIDITGNTGRCGEFQPITLTIDGESVVQSTPAKPPVPAGFQSLPQAMMPRVEIGIGPDRFADTARAVSIMAGLQRVSKLPIDTAVVELQQAVDGDSPAVLIAADGWEGSDIALPVAASEDGLTIQGFGTTGEPVDLQLEPAVGFGSLQTVLDGNRSLLVATSNGAARQLDQLLRWLDDDPQRWSRLDGNAVVSVPGRAPVTVPTVAASAPQAQQGGDGGELTWLLWVAAGVGIVAALGAAWLIRGRSRRA